MFKKRLHSLLQTAPPPRSSTYTNRQRRKHTLTLILGALSCPPCTALTSIQQLLDDAVVIGQDGVVQGCAALEASTVV